MICRDVALQRLYKQMIRLIRTIIDEIQGRWLHLV